jgi:hypothetical protein
MPDFVVSILIMIFWFIIISAVGKFFKRMMSGNQDASKNPPLSKQPNKPQKTFQDIIKEIQKQVDESTQQQNIPPYARTEVKEVKPESDVREVKPVSEVREVKPVTEKQQSRINTNKQIVIKEREILSQKEKERSREYEKFVAGERRKEHDAEQRNLEKKIYAITSEEDDQPFVNFDLRNAIIANAILERPYD